MLPSRRQRQAPWPPRRRRHRALPPRQTWRWLLLLSALTGLLAQQLEQTSPLLQARVTAGNQVYASNAGPFTCAPTGISWGRMESDDDDDDDHPTATIVCTNHGHWPLPLQVTVQNLAGVQASPHQLTIAAQASANIQVQLVHAEPGSQTGRLVIEGSQMTVVIPIQYELHVDAAPPDAKTPDANKPAAKAQDPKTEGGTKRVKGS